MERKPAFAIGDRVSFPGCRPSAAKLGHRWTGKIVAIDRSSLPNSNDRTHCFGVVVDQTLDKCVRWLKPLHMSVVRRSGTHSI